MSWQFHFWKIREGVSTHFSRSSAIDGMMELLKEIDDKVANQPKGGDQSMVGGERCDSNQSPPPPLIHCSAAKLKARQQQFGLVT